MKFPFLRVAAILLGIVSAVMLAHDGFHITFAEWTATFFKAVDNFFGGILGPVEDYVIHPLIELLRRYGIHLELQKHWKYAFLLLWVLMGGVARTAALVLTANTAAFYWAWGGVCAFIGGLMSGTAALFSLATFLWPMAAFAVYLSGLNACLPLFRSPADRSLTLQFGFWGFFFAVDERPWFGWFGLGCLISAFAMVSSHVAFPGLAALAAFVGFAALLFVVAGGPGLIGDERRWWQKWLGSANRQLGLDILFILGGATAVTALARYTGLVGS